MCFEVDNEAKPWPNKVVYKVVAKGRFTTLHRKDVLAGPWKSECVYVAGRRKTRSKGSTVFSPIAGCPETSHGIYVMRTLAAAHRFARQVRSMTGISLASLRILKCKVSPRSFLHAAVATDSKYKDSATYHCVTPFGRPIKVR